MTLPLEAFTIAPVRVRAPSEARKAASRAVSATVDELFRTQLSRNYDTEFVIYTFIATDTFNMRHPSSYESMSQWSSNIG
jgi:hypothetical protein